MKPKLFSVFLMSFNECSGFVLITMNRQLLCINVNNSSQISRFKDQNECEYSMKNYSTKLQI